MTHDEAIFLASEAYRRSAEARQEYLQACADALAAGVSETRLSRRLGMSTEAVRRLRQRGRLPKPSRQASP